MTRTEEEWLQLASRHNFRGRMDQREFTGPIFERGRDSLIWDVNGKEYLDFNSGQMCAALGHNHPKIVEAIRKSTETLIHASCNWFNTSEIELAARLGELLPPELSKSTFLMSGSDSNEAAMNMAKVFTGRHEIASPVTSFHGLSDSSRSVTFSGWHSGYGPNVGTYAIMAPYRYRCKFCQNCKDCTLDCLETSFEILDAQSVGSLAAVITEPLFSAGGVIPAPTVWLKALKDKCNDRDMLLIFDEAQTGLGKLGAMFGFQKHDVIPDILTISKHFGGGVSISAAITNERVEATIVDRGFTCGQSHSNDPLCCHAGIASLDIIVEGNLPTVAEEKGGYFQSILNRLAQKYEVIGDVRGMGLIQGIEFVVDRMSKKPAFSFGKQLQKLLMKNGILSSVRRKGSVIRFVPPFTTTTEQFDRAGDILDKSISDLLEDRSLREE